MPPKARYKGRTDGHSSHNRISSLDKLKNLIIKAYFLLLTPSNIRWVALLQAMTPGSRFIPYCIPATPTYGRHVPMEEKWKWLYMRNFICQDWKWSPSLLPASHCSTRAQGSIQLWGKLRNVVYGLTMRRMDIGAHWQYRWWSANRRKTSNWQLGVLIMGLAGKAHLNTLLYLTQSNRHCCLYKATPFSFAN